MCRFTVGTRHIPPDYLTLQLHKPVSQYTQTGCCRTIFNIYYLLNLFYFMLTFEEKNNRKNLIVFIHGLIGGRDTWVRQDGKKSILTYLKEDKEITDQFDLAVFDYFTKLTDLFQKLSWLTGFFTGHQTKLKKNFPIKDIADILSTDLRIRAANYENIVLVSHSMGGLVAKAHILDDLQETSKSRVMLYISLAVPHNGSNLASLGRMIYSNPQIKGLQPLSEEISGLNQRWVKSIGLPDTYYFQGKADDIVPPNSSEGIDRRTISPIYSDDDHFSIVTPGVDSSVLAAVRQKCLLALKPEKKMAFSAGQRTGADQGPIIMDDGTKVYIGEPMNMLFADLMKNDMQSKQKRAERKRHESTLAVKLEADIKDIDFFRRQITDNNGNNFTIEEMCDAIRNTDQSVICGIGGVGKSVLLKRAAVYAINNSDDSFTIWLDAKHWTENYSEEIKKTHPIEHRFRNLLNGFRETTSSDDIALLEHSKTDSSVTKYLFLDGLNEISVGSTRAEITDLLHELRRDYNFKICIVTRPNNNPEYGTWRQIQVRGVPESELKKIVEARFTRPMSDYTDNNRTYLAIPFFLDIAIRSGKDVIKSYADYINGHVLKSIAAKARPDALKDLSQLAFAAYKTDHKLIIPKTSVTPVLKRKYADTKILTETDEGFYFEHQLVNDYFVAYRIAQQPDLWTEDTFDLVTFGNRSSFEIIQMILEQLSDQHAGDSFLLAVYDWNFYAVLHCLRYVDNRFTNEFAVTLIMILSEKIFDRFPHTRIRVWDYLKPLYSKFSLRGINPDALQEDLKNLSSKREPASFIAFVKANEPLFIHPYYREWFRIFTEEVGYSRERVLSRIIDDNPVMGWSVANLLKRTLLTAAAEAQLRILYLTGDDSIKKWRIVHALGNASEQDSVTLLLETISSSSYIWIVYGAVRSLLEIAIFTASSEDCADLLRSLMTLFENRSYDPSVMKEFAACLQMKVSADKKEIFSAVIDETVASGHTNFDDRALWQQVRQQFIDNNA